MCTAGFPEPLHLQPAGPQGAGRAPAATSTSSTTTSAWARACSGMIKDGWPLLATLHHPITVDRDLELAARHAGHGAGSRCGAGTASSRMQVRVARQLPRIITVSESSRGRHRRRRWASTADRIAVVPSASTTAGSGRCPHIERVPGPAHDDGQRRRPAQGPGAAARGGGQGAHRAPRRAGRHRQAPGRRAGWARRSSRLGLRGRRHVRERRHRRAHRRAVRRGRGGRRAVAVRGLLAARHRGHGVRRAAGRHDRRGPARGRRHRTATPALLVPPGDPGALAARHRPGARRRRRCAPALGAAGRERVLDRFTWRRDGRGHRRRSTGSTCVASARRC